MARSTGGRGQTRDDVGRTLDAPLVLTHSDMNMHNILVGDDGKIWLIDWAWSGFFPNWFEYASMIMAVDECPHSFQRCVPFIADPFVTEQTWIGGTL